jgi:hypothetical protein
MYVTTEIIREVEQRSGIPVVILREYEMTPKQLDIVRLGQKHGRCPDVTLVIVDDERNIVVTRKPSYPLGAYRTLSQGVEVGKAMEMAYDAAQALKASRAKFVKQLNSLHLAGRCENRGQRGNSGNRKNIAEARLLSISPRRQS